jgi:hypothetical protein
MISVQFIIKMALLIFLSIKIVGGGGKKLRKFFFVIFSLYCIQFLLSAFKFYNFYFHTNTNTYNFFYHIL